VGIHGKWGASSSERFARTIAIILGCGKQTINKYANERYRGAIASFLGCQRRDLAALHGALVCFCIIVGHRGGAGEIVAPSETPEIVAESRVTGRLTLKRAWRNHAVDPSRDTFR